MSLVDGYAMFMRCIQTADSTNDKCYTFRSDYDLFQIELSKNYGTTEWHDDLKKVMMKAGMDNVPMVFLFSDTQVRRL